MQSEYGFALTLSPRRGDRFLPRWQQLLNRWACIALENGLPRLGGRIPGKEFLRIEPLNRSADNPFFRIAENLVGRALASLRAPKLQTLRRLENLRHGRQECLRYVRFMGGGVGFH